MRNPFDNPGKKTVREAWNTPLLQFLNSEHGFRYRYMGLPGIDILDLQLWRHMIDEVVAFESRAKPENNDPDGRRNVLALRTKMRQQGINGHAYFGSMEEVVILGRDQDGAKYDQSKLVTLYNLDFCDEISSPVQTLNAGSQVWRFEAIRHILRDQKACYEQGDASGYFVLLLTVRDQIGVDKLALHFSQPFADSQQYWNSCQQSCPLPTTGYVLGQHSWSLKTLIHDQMRQWFGNPNVSALFFPVVKYTGSPISKTVPSPMLHVMVLCRFAELTVSSPLFLPNQFLTSATCARANDDGTMVWDPEPGEPKQLTGLPDSREWFKQHQGSLVTDHRTGVSKSL